MQALQLHLDLNKTLIIEDKIQRLSLDRACIQILTWSTWGHMDRRKQWTWDQTPPSLHHPDPEAMTYGAYLRKMKLRRKDRFAKQHIFLQPGQPGEAITPHLEHMRTALRLPQAHQEALDGQAWAKRAHLDQGHVRLLPSFFKLLRHLDRKKIPTTLIFRTYGSDLDSVATELNAFCQGQHPAAPGLRLDGSTGGKDWRLHMDKPERFGALHRGGPRDNDLNTLSLALGTWDNPPGRDRPPYPCHYSFFKKHADRVITGTDAVWEHLKAQQGHTLGWRDDYAAWARHRFTAYAGKPLCWDPEDKTRRTLFFDDNIHHDDPHIIDVRDPHGSPLPGATTLQQCLVRVDPFQAITDDNYFINHLTESP